MKINNLKLIRALQKAYSAEKAAAYAYIGHSGSVKNKLEKAAIKQIEIDEWIHREEVLKIMQEYQIPISRYDEIKFHLIGRLIGTSCYLIGWFMPNYFAGRLESGNVCEYFRIIRIFDSLGIQKHHEVIYQMGVKEKEHEVYFLNSIRHHKLLPLFEKIFGWGRSKSFNQIDLENLETIENSGKYCEKE